jgi:predicted dienelactone hydrolase
MWSRLSVILWVSTALTACETAPVTQQDAAVDGAVMDARGKTDGPFLFPFDHPVITDPMSWDVRARGRFQAGYRVVMHTYTPRGSTMPRTIPVHIWYPTHAIEGPNPTYSRIVPDEDSFVDAPLAALPDGRRYPVHVYSHGDRGFGGTSHSLMVYFATHGWVSIAPDHVGNTFSGNIAPRPFSLYHMRAQDVRASLDALDGLPVNDAFAGRCATDRVVLSGHSFGVHTVWSAVGATFDIERSRGRCMASGACNEADLDVMRMGLVDSRIVAAIPMAGAIARDFFGTDGHRSVTVPLLAMSGSEDPVGADVQFMTTAPMPMTWIDIRGACHQFFALGGCSTIADTEQDLIVNTWALAFARAHVLRDNTSVVRDILDGTLSLSDRITFHRR